MPRAQLPPDVPARVAAAAPARGRFRSVGVTLVLLAATAFFLYWVQSFTPLRHWLAWRFLLYWALAIVFYLSAISAGNLLLRRLLERYLPLDEQLLLSAGLGVLAFGLVFFTLGVAGLLSGWTFCLVPAAFLALGSRSLLALAARYRRHAALLRRPQPRRLPRWLRLGMLGFGVLALGLLYATILTPSNVAYDSRWYHLAAAEQYAVQGGIRRFPDGWFVGAYPQLATWLYTWAFLLPTGTFFDHVELAAHLEFVAFSFTLFGIPVLVRRLLGGGGYGLSWAARFLFPGVFLYDSGLALGADHVAAFWAIPIFLSYLRAQERLELRRCLLLTACLAGALLTKYSAVGLALFPAAGLAWRALQLSTWRPPAHGRWLPLRHLALMSAAGLVLTAPHWLKNWLWYHDPVYPLMYSRFSPRPWTQDTPDRFGHFMPVEWSAPHSLQGVWDTAVATFDFSFVPHDWPEFHGAVPVFGSLFTLALPCLPFLRPRRRTLLLFASCHAGIALWYWMFHQDRYLQTLLPWMAAGTAAVGIGIWRLGWIPRLALGLLVLAQLAWGGDTPFIPGHAMAGGTPFKPAIDLLSSSYRQDFKQRLRPYEPWASVKALATPGGTVMLHEMHLHLGIGMPTVSDGIGWQGGVSYVRTAKPSQMYAALRGMGVTDILWGRSSRGYDSLGGDLAFYSFVTRQAPSPQTVGGYWLSRLPASPPSDVGFQDLALVLGCNDSYASGLYRISDLSVTVLSQPRPATDYPEPVQALAPGANLGELLPRVDAVAVNQQCFAAKKLARFGLEQVSERKGFEIWIRGRAVTGH